MSDISLLLTLLRVSKNGKIESSKGLHRMVCMLKYKYNIPFSYNFRIYHYGPYSDSLAEMVDTLQAFGHIQDTREVLDNGVAKCYYSLTDSGKDRVDNQDISQDELDAFKTAVKTLEEKSVEDLIDESKMMPNLY